MTSGKEEHKRNYIVLKYNRYEYYDMSSILDKLVRWWENWKYPEDKEKQKRIDAIIDEMDKKSSKYDPKKPRLIKS
jgi:hypothetical protein